MRNILFTFFCLFVGTYSAFPQTSEKDVVGVAKFTSEVNSPFVDAVAEKVVQSAAGFTEQTLRQRKD